MIRLPGWARNLNTARTAGEGGERSETGEGFAAFQIFSRHSARGALVVSPVVRERALRRRNL
jgi:hypothetical protein